jgi:hypothetical protein
LEEITDPSLKAPETTQPGVSLSVVMEALFSKGVVIADVIMRSVDMDAGGIRADGLTELCFKISEASNAFVANMVFLSILLGASTSPANKLAGVRHASPNNPFGLIKEVSMVPWAIFE